MVITMRSLLVTRGLFGNSIQRYRALTGNSLEGFKMDKKLVKLLRSKKPEALNNYQLIYCAVSNKIFEYFTEDQKFYIFDGEEEAEVNPFNIWVAVSIKRSAEYL